ncbi:hypothetical protein Gotur_006570, partial [Gossypium turneri]
MSGASTAAYLARRAAQKERVRILYRRALKDTLNWAVHRHLFYQDVTPQILKSSNLPISHLFTIEDLDTIDKMIDAGEATYNKWRHPDPYIGTYCIFFVGSFVKRVFSFAVPWAPGGSKFTRNPVPPSGVSVICSFLATRVFFPTFHAVWLIALVYIRSEAGSIPLSRLVYWPVPSPTGWSVLVSTTLDICAR